MTSPMKKVPEWDVTDSSKVKDLLTCERLFFFKRILKELRGVRGRFEFSRNFKHALNRRLHCGSCRGG